MVNRSPLAEILASTHENWPEYDRQETRVMLAVIRLNELVFESTREILDRFNLTLTGFETLMTLRGQPAPWEMTPTALFQTVLVTSGGMTKVLKSLEQGGLIERAANPDDNRSRLVRLTSKGKKCAEDSMEAVAAHDRAILTGALTDQQIEQLSRVLMRTVNKIEAG